MKNSLRLASLLAGLALCAAASFAHASPVSQVPQHPFAGVAAAGVSSTSIAVEQKASMSENQTAAPVMRAKMAVLSIGGTAGVSETLSLGAVCKSDGYPADGADEDNTFAKWTPSANLTMTINNPALHGKFTVGDKFYVDFTPAPAA